MNRTRKNKEVLNMNNEITFHKAQSDSPSDNDIQLIQNMFPEFKYNYIKKLLKKNHLNKESTIEELLSERFIQQTVSENDIKRNSKILEIYNVNIFILKKKKKKTFYTNIHKIFNNNIII